MCSEAGCMAATLATVLLLQSKVFKYRGSPDSTNFGPPGDRTIAKIVLSGD